MQVGRHSTIVPLQEEVAPMDEDLIVPLRLATADSTLTTKYYM